MAKTKLAQPWWLEVGTDVCPACNHPYAYQTEFYCVDCDGPVCALCVIKTVEVGHLCPTCIPSRDSKLEGRN